LFGFGQVPSSSNVGRKNIVRKSGWQAKKKFKNKRICKLEMQLNMFTLYEVVN